MRALCAVAVVFFVIVVALLIWGSSVARRRERERLAALHSWAQANGWTGVENPDVGWAARLPGRERRGVHRAFHGVIGDRPVSIGEYSMTETSTTTSTDASGNTTHGTTSTTHHYRVAVAHLSRPFPATTVENRGGLSRMARAIAGPNASATGNPAFDNAFRIRTEHPAAVPVWFTPQLIDAHLRREIPLWSIFGNELLTFGPGRLDNPSVIVGLADQVAYLAALIDPLTPPIG